MYLEDWEEDALFEDLLLCAREEGAHRTAAKVAYTYVALLAETASAEAEEAEGRIRAALEAALPAGARLEGTELAVKDVRDLVVEMQWRAVAATFDPFLEGNMLSGVRSCCMGVCDALGYVAVVPDGRLREACDAVAEALCAAGYGVYDVRDLDADPLTRLPGTCAEFCDAERVPFEVMFVDEQRYPALFAARAEASRLMEGRRRLDHIPAGETRYYAVTIPSTGGVRVSEKLVRARRDGTTETFGGQTSTWRSCPQDFYWREVAYGTGLAREVTRAEADAMLEAYYGDTGAA